MSKILVEKFLGIGKWNEKNLQKTQDKLVSNFEKYNKAEKTLKDKGMEDADLMSAKFASVTKQADKHSKIKESLAKQKEAWNEKKANMLVKGGRGARRFDMAKMTPELKALYDKKLADKKAGVLDTGGSKVSIDDIVKKFKTVSESKLATIYDERIILSESFNSTSLKESYSEEEFFQMLDESVLNFDTLNEEELLHLVNSLGYDYLEEGKTWNKVKRIGATAALVATGALMPGIHGNIKDSQAYNAAHHQQNAIVRTQDDTIAKTNAEKLNIIDNNIEYTPEKREEHKTAIETATAKKEEASKAAAAAAAARDSSRVDAGLGGAAALGTAAVAIAESKRRKKESNNILSSKNKEINDLKERVKSSKEKSIA